MTGRGEYSGGPGMPRDAARQLRREGLAEKAGLTGGYVRQNKPYVIPTPAEDAWEEEEDEVAVRREGFVMEESS